MKITTEYVYPPIPCRQYDWSAVDSDTYDWAPDGQGQAADQPSRRQSMTCWNRSLNATLETEMKISPYYMTPTGLATVRAAAALMGARLRAMRLERQASVVLTRPEPQLVIR